MQSQQEISPLRRKYKTILVILVVFILLPVSLIFSLPLWLPVVVGFWLPEGSHITLNAGIKADRDGLTIHGADYWTQGCKMASLEDARLGYSDRWQLNIARLSLDPDCLATPASAAVPSRKPLLISALQSSLPDSEVRVENLLIKPWPQYQGALTLTLSPARQMLHYRGSLLTTDIALSQRALTINALKIKLTDDRPPFELAGRLTLALQAEGIPPEGELKTHFIMSDTHQRLDATLQWQENSGILRVTDASHSAAVLSLPWSVTGNVFEVKGGQWRWPLAGYPLQGGMALRIDGWQDGLEKMIFTGRANVVTQGQAGKGNAVLNIGPGKISLANSALPLRLTGEIKRDRLVFYALLQGLADGPLTDPALHFAPGSLLRSQGLVLPGLSLDEVRWPLAGVRLSREGIEGRLQAILKARESHLGHMALHLDGGARDFIPDRQGIWQWRYWGKGVLTPLQAAWDVKGSGQWSGSRLVFRTLSTGFDRLAYGQASVARPRLRLKEPLVWSRIDSQQQLSGRFILDAGETTLGQGGSRLPPAALAFDIAGSSPSDLQFKGALQAERIGPVRVSGRWDGERLRGNAWWPRQSLTVFQPLLPEGWKTELKGGELYAQVAFSAAEGQGFEAGGHGVVRQGRALMPDNAITGVDFVLPFRYRAGRWHFGTRGPVSLRIAEVRNQFSVRHITADLQGWYPWDESQPLWLSDVSAEALGGKVIMRQLRLPQKEAALIRLQNISSSELMQAINPKQFTFSGRFNGGLPLWLSHPRWIIKDGWLSNPGPLTFRMDKEMADAIADKNLVAGAAINWIRYLEIAHSWARLSLDNLGEMVMSASVTGISQRDGKRATVNLHYHHQENLFSLWRSLRFGDNLQTWLEENATLPLIPCQQRGGVCEEQQ